MIPDRPLRVYVVSGEVSGDRLGGALVEALRALAPAGLTARGVTGPAMVAAGVATLYPVTDLSVMGPRAVLAKLPTILRRLAETVDDVAAFDPDVLILIDAPDFTRMVARRVRKRRPDIRIVKYVAPQIWAWRSWRGRQMRAYLDHVLALLPFEPAFYARVGAPPATYVGHPIIEQRAALRPVGDERDHGPPVLLVLPGSRSSEVARLMAPFGETVGRVAADVGPLRVVIPAVPHLTAAIRAAAATWPVAPEIVEGEAAKQAAFRSARAALAASGTVTLELAVAGVPSVVAYRMEAWFAAILRRLIEVKSVVLANLVLERNVMPEFLQEDVRPEAMAPALVALLRDTPERAAQLAAFADIDRLMGTDGAAPSERAARTVLDVISAAR